MAAVFRSIRRRSWLPVGRRVSVLPELRQIRDVEKLHLPPATLHPLHCVSDDSVVPRFWSERSGILLRLREGRAGSAVVPGAVAAGSSVHVVSLNLDDFGS